MSEGTSAEFASMVDRIEAPTGVDSGGPKWRKRGDSIETGIAFPRFLNLKSLGAAEQGEILHQLDSLDHPSVPEWLALRRLASELRLRADMLVTTGLEEKGARITWQPGLRSIGLTDLSPRTDELFNVLVVLVEDKVLDTRPVPDCEAFDDLVAREMLLLQPLHIRPELSPAAAIDSLVARLAAIVGRRLNQGEQWAGPCASHMDDDGVVFLEVEHIPATNADDAFKEVELQNDLEWARTEILRMGGAANQTLSRFIERRELWFEPQAHIAKVLGKSAMSFRKDMSRARPVLRELLWGSAEAA
jgi:hypothetical protein